MKKITIEGVEIQRPLVKNGRKLKINFDQFKKDCKRRELTENQLLRLEVISLAIAGVNYGEICVKYDLHRSTVTEWCRYYQNEGLKGLDRPLKPIEKKILDAAELISLLSGSGETDRAKLLALIELSESGNTKATAKNHKITPQGLLKWKRKYLAGEIPASQFF